MSFISINIFIIFFLVNFDNSYCAPITELCETALPVPQATKCVPTQTKYMEYLQLIQEYKKIEFQKLKHLRRLQDVPYDPYFNPLVLDDFYKLFGNRRPFYKAMEAYLAQPSHLIDLNASALEITRFQAWVFFPDAHGMGIQLWEAWANVPLKTVEDQRAALIELKELELKQMHCFARDMEQGVLHIGILLFFLMVGAIVTASIDY